MHASNPRVEKRDFTYFNIILKYEGVRGPYKESKSEVRTPEVSLSPLIEPEHSWVRQTTEESEAL